MAKRKSLLEEKKKMWESRIRELEAELAVRDNMGDEVLRILREATGKRDFHSEMEAAEWAAKMLADAREAFALSECERSELRSALRQTIQALGGIAEPGVSLQFLLLAPQEAAAVRAQLADARLGLERLLAERVKKEEL